MPVTINGSDGGNAFTQGSILGAVSQTAGVPTGAIIEKGSNANGNFVKYADGTLICDVFLELSSRISFGAGTIADPYRSGIHDWTYPHAFSADPVLSIVPQMNSGTAQARASGVAFQFRGTTSVTSIQVAAISSNATDFIAFASCIAIGRWY